MAQQPQGDLVSIGPPDGSVDDAYVPLLEFADGMK
jgi:hypothetical protein